jgi:hypothetical protein
VSHGVTTCFMCIVERLKRFDHILFNYCYVVEVSCVGGLVKRKDHNPAFRGNL